MSEDSTIFLLKDGENLGIKLFFSELEFRFGVDDLVRGDGARLLPADWRLGWGGGVPMFRRTGGGVLVPDMATSFLLLGSRLDLDRCM